MSPAYCMANASTVSAGTPHAAPDARSTTGTGKTSTRKLHFTARTTAAGRPWKNSRVLNEPPMNPWAFCSILGCLMPMAVWSDDFGRIRAFRTRLAARVHSATIVSTIAADAYGVTRSGAAKNAYAAAKVNPEAQPSVTKFTIVQGLAHSCRKRMHA